MKIAFVIARVGTETNVIQKMAVRLAVELRKFAEVTVFPFSRSSVFKPFPYWKLKRYDLVLIANVGLQCAYYSLFKKLGFIHKPYVAISFGSDIRNTREKLCNLFNSLCVKQVDLVIAMNPDLVEIAKARGYRRVGYVNSWAGAL